MEVLKPSEVLKALEQKRPIVDVKTKQVYFSDQYKTVLLRLANNKEFSILQKEHGVVRMTGLSHSGECWDFSQFGYSITGTHSITFSVDEEGNPICDTIKMEKL